MLRTLALVSLLSLAGSAHAQAVPTCGPPLPMPIPPNAVSWAWDLPTVNDDRVTPLTPPITITLYEGATKVCQVVDASAASLSNLSPGTHSWSATASTAKDGEGGWSNMVMKTVVPLGYHVDPTNLIAFTVNTTDGAVTSLEVGKVPAGTACDTSSVVRPYGAAQMLYHVPEASVTFLPNVSAIVTLAACLPN